MVLWFQALWHVDVLQGCKNFDLFFSCVWSCILKGDKLLGYNSNKISNFLTDTITLIYELNSAIQIQVPMLKSGITWWTDKYVKFGNPANANLSDHFAGKTYSVAKYSYVFITNKLCFVCVRRYPWYFLCIALMTHFYSSFLYQLAPLSRIYQNHEKAEALFHSSLPLER